MYHILYMVGLYSSDNTKKTANYSSTSSQTHLFFFILNYQNKSDNNTVVAFLQQYEGNISITSS